LLLNKWKAESSRVLAFASSAKPGFSARMEGTIARVDDTGTACLSSDGNFIMFNLDCIIGYGEQCEMLDSFEDAVNNETKKWTALLLLKYADGERLVLCSMD
ncbi:MAG: hypothetical protein WCF61_16250, partial [Terriglobales bacterium]